MGSAIWSIMSSNVRLMPSWSARGQTTIPSYQYIGFPLFVAAGTF
jgi:hypothetical protein